MTICKVDQIYNTIGKNIKKYRKLRGLTQKQLGDKLSYSENFIAKLESKTPQSLSIIALWDIGKELDVPIGNFYDESVNDIVK